jgi:YVTN family beta-propeller protein
MDGLRHLDDGLWGTELMRSSVRTLFCGMAVVLATASGSQAQTDFVEFESGPVRPIALSPDGSQLFVCNIPDNHLEIFDVTPSGLVHSATVQVGMEPVSVAARNNDEVWVVNHLSDSVSVVDVASDPPRVLRTLLVGDEPRDIVFAGTGGNRAFITTAHRGQHRNDTTLTSNPNPVTGAGDPQLTTPGIGRADVWVFDATNLGNTLGGKPHRIVTLFSDTPRALAVSPDGNTVYAAAHFSGNQTTVINETVVPDDFDSAGPSGGAPGGVPAPSAN